MGALESETLSASSRAFISPGPTTWVQSVQVLMLVILVALQALPAACSAVALLVSYPHGGHRCGHSSAFNYKPIVRVTRNDERMLREVGHYYIVDLETLARKPDIL